MKILLNNSTRKCRIMIGGTPAEIQLRKGDSIFVYTDGVAVIRVTVHEDPRSAEITFIDKVK